MSFDLVAYEKLKLSIIESIKTLIHHHDKDHKIDSNKLEESVKILPEERRVQSLVLLKTIEQLDAVKSSDTQARVLNAMAVYIRDQIEVTYKRTSPENSKLYQLLTISLAINQVNKPDRTDLLEMYNPLRSFLRSNVYNKDPLNSTSKPDPRHGRLVAQPFAIEGYNITTVLKDLNHKIVAMDDQNIDDDLELFEKQQKSGKATGLLGGIFGGSAPKAKDPKTKKDPSSSALVM